MQCLNLWLYPFMFPTYCSWSLSAIPTSRASIASIACTHMLLYSSSFRPFKIQTCTHLEALQCHTAERSCAPGR